MAVPQGLLEDVGELQPAGREDRYTECINDTGSAWMAVPLHRNGWQWTVDRVKSCDTYGEACHHKAAGQYERDCRIHGEIHCDGDR